MDLDQTHPSIIPQQNRSDKVMDRQFHLDWTYQCFIHQTLRILMENITGHTF